MRETACAEETEAFGRELARTLGAGDAVLLQGDLGAGKSVLARGIVRGLPHGEGRTVRSPTFVYCIHHPTDPPVQHIDLYRIPMDADPGEFGLDELAGGEGIALIEWAQRVDPARFPRPVVVRIEVLGGEKRRISVEFPP